MEIKANNGTPVSNRAFSPSSSFESLSASDLEAAASSSSSPSAARRFPKYPSYSSYSRRSMVGPALRSPRSPRRFFSSTFLTDHDDDGAHHFLDSCHLCKKPLGGGRDIFMYRGDTPFCSEECRQEQIEMDEAQEKRIKMAQKQQQKSGKSSTSPSKSEKIHMRVTGTVVAG